MSTPKNNSEHARPFLFSKLNVALVLLVGMLLPIRFAWANDSGLEDQLKSEYKDKTLTLRHFYSGDHLRFSADGALNGNATVGPWTLDGQISVEEIHLRDGFVVIKGRRVHLVFDSQLKPQDQLMTIDNDHGEKHKDKDLEKMLRRLTVEIEIELPGEKLDQKEVSSAIDAVFITASESMIDMVPSFWRAYIAKQEGKPQIAPSLNGPPYHIKRGEVSGPHANYLPDPEYSEEAREAKYNGTVVMSLVVDSSGAPTDLQIDRPLGLGLDEKAVEAVSSWEFEPGQKEGEPVAVRIAVEVSFHLY